MLCATGVSARASSGVSGEPCPVATDPECPAAAPSIAVQAEAARNDQRILDSARAVFVADPGAPITAVAKHAGVGISALYTRYGSKEELLRTLCTDGLVIVVSQTEAAIERVKEGDNRWQVFAGFMRNLADPGRTSELRHRYLALILDGMRATDRGGLPGPPPTWPELSARWRVS